MEAYPRIRDAWIRMLVALDETLDEDQRTRMVRRIGGLGDDLAGEINMEVALGSFVPNDPPCSALF